MNRRQFHLQVTAALGHGLLLSACANPGESQDQHRWASIEEDSGGRLGIAMLQADGQLTGHRLDDRFPMCSTFKWLAAALVLQRVDSGQDRLDRRITFGREVLLPHSPLTSLHAGGAGMTLGELCEATITTSDNAAANLILESFGGPAAVTSYARSLGDQHTRLDRWEPELNEARPSDPRDTTTPRAMARLLHATLVGDALSPRSRDTLARWLEATQTNTQRLRANLLAGWRMGSKTGSGVRGTTNDVGIFWPPGGRPPVLAAVFLTESDAPEAVRNGAVAQVARVVTAEN